MRKLILILFVCSVWCGSAFGEAGLAEYGPIVHAVTDTIRLASADSDSTKTSWTIPTVNVEKMWLAVRCSTITDSSTVRIDLQKTFTSGGTSLVADATGGTSLADIAAVGTATTVHVVPDSVITDGPGSLTVNFDPVGTANVFIVTVTYYAIMER